MRLVRRAVNAPRPAQQARRWAAAAARVLLAATLSWTAVVGQGQARTARPDISGVWRMARAGEGARPEQLTPPIPPPPLSPAFAAAFAERQAAYRRAEAEGRPLARDRELCIPDGFPRMLTTDSPLEILLSEGQVALVTEFLSQVRRIDIRRAAHPPADELTPTFFGDSIGRWEGDVLVVDTVGLREATLLFNDAPHSAALRIVERIRLIAPDTLEDRLSITDAEALTAPWTVTRLFVRRPDLRVAEFVCEEGNRNYRDADGRLATRMPE